MRALCTRLCSGILFAAFVVAATGCPPPALLPDAGPANDAGTTSDGGIIASDGGVIDPDGGVQIPLTERARMLCAWQVQGEQNAAALLAPLSSECTPGDGRFDSVVDDDAVVDTTTQCLPTKPLYQRYLALLTGDTVDIDLDALEACREAGQQARAGSSSVAQRTALVGQLDGLRDGALCQGAITGLLGAGDACAYGIECAAPLRCEPVPPSSGQAVCTPPAAGGEPCGFSADGRILRTCAAGSTCYLELCVPPRPVGGTCGANDPACADGLVCTPAGTCAAPGLDGDACSTDGQCEGERVCQNSVCRVAPTEGEACVAGDRCIGACVLCRPDDLGALRCLAPAGAETPCGADAHCAAPLYCGDIDGLTLRGTCTAPANVGAACGITTPCAAGLTCRTGEASVGADGGPGLTDAGPPTGPVCFPAAANGEACSNGTLPCATGICAFDTCVAGVLGDACTNDNGCTGTLLCEAEVCIEAPRADAPCTDTGRCGEDLFCDGLRCRVAPPAGAACGPFGYCDDQAYCLEALCTARGPAGAVCAADNECLSDVCLLSGLCAFDAPDDDTTRSGLLWLVLLSLPLAGVARIRRRGARA